MVIVLLLMDQDVLVVLWVVFDDICVVCGIDYVNNFWCVLVYDLDSLCVIWDWFGVVMVFGVLDLLVKELVYIVVFVMNGCFYCVYFYMVVVCVKGMIVQ